jgi:hypothetical protein
MEGIQFTGQMENNRNLQVSGTNDEGNSLVMNLHFNEDEETARGSIQYSSGANLHTGYDDAILKKVAIADEGRDATELDGPVEEAEPEWYTLNCSSLQSWTLGRADSKVLVKDNNAPSMGWSVGAANGKFISVFDV